MRGYRTTTGSKSQKARTRTYHVAPIARAVRSALAVSAFALAGTGTVYAGDCGTAAAHTQFVRCAQAEQASAPVVDLTRVSGEGTSALAAPSHVQAAAFAVNIVNNSTIDITGSGQVIGLYADFPGADVKATNRGTIDVESVDDLADGIFAYGATVTATNSGTIDASGATWGAGIEAQGDTVTLTNTGTISGSASAYDTENGIYGHAYGIYAAGGDGGVSVTNRGTVEATGPFATGIFAYDSGAGGISIINRGQVTATAENGYATAINALTNTEGSDISVLNAATGSVTANGMNGATGIAASATGLGSKVSVDNRGDIYAASTTYYSVAAGISIFADGDASLRNSGTITIGYGDYAYGGLVLAFAGDSEIQNSGTVSVAGGFGAYGFVAASQNGYADVTNTAAGAITADSGFGTAAGIDASSYLGTTINNAGSIDATASKYSFGVLANTSLGDTVVNNSGSITSDGKYGFGVLTQSGDGNATLENSGTISGSGKYAYGAVVSSNYGDATINNAAEGTLSGGSDSSLAVGAFANANNDGNATVNNQGLIEAIGSGYAQVAYGAVVQTDAGDALVVNSGDITASNSYGAATGVIVRSSAGGDATLQNDGSISAIATGSGVYESYYGTYTVNTDVIGAYVYAPGAVAAVINNGSIEATTQAGTAVGAYAGGGFLSYVINSGDVTATGDTGAIGIASAGYYSYAINDGSITANSAQGAARGMQAVGVFAYGLNYGAVSAQGDSATGILGSGDYGTLVFNSGDVTATAGNGNATGASAFGSEVALVQNVGGLTASSTGGDAIGAYAYSYGQTQVVNDGDISATSATGLADGVFAYGADVYVLNNGNIAATGGTWAAGIEAQGSNSTEVVNLGEITATATTYDTEGQIYGHAYGIYATGGDGGVVVYNGGTVASSGTYATGIHAYDSGSGGVQVVNAGVIGATAETGFATGINALTNVEGSDITVVNSGDVSAIGLNGGTGIAAVATGLGASGSVTNTGDIYARSQVYYSVAEGISISADQDATLSNSGTILIGYGDYAYGGVALAFAGDSTVENSGSVTVNGGLSATGFVAASQNGFTDVTSTAEGSITVDSAFGNGIGIDASSYLGTTVVNDGIINATGNSNAVGVLANSGQGDTMVANSGTIATDGKYSFGVLAQSGDGNAAVVNTGSISGTGKYAYGAVAASAYGNSTIYNAGDIAATSEDLLAVGAFVNANGDSDAAITNVGSISASGSGYAQVAYAAVAQSDAGTALISNGDTGTISADNSYGTATAVRAVTSAGGPALVVNSGTITATTTGPGVIEGYYGTYTVNTDAIGVYAYAPGGVAQVDNSGTIAATSAAGLADGVFAAGGSVYVSNSGSITADGYTWGAGIEAQGDDDTYVINTGTIAASALAYAPGDPETGTEGVYGHAYGIYATSGDNGILVDNQGAISATGPYATGVFAYGGGTTGIEIANEGEITASAVEGFANGINVSAIGSGDVHIANSGLVDASGYNVSTGISVLSSDAGSDVTISNAGDISAVTAPEYKYGNASGISVSAEGALTVRNTAAGTIYASGADAYGVLGLAFSGNANVSNAGDITVESGPFFYSSAYGIVSSSQGGAARGSNLGTLSVSSNGLISVGRGVDVSGVSATGINEGDIDVSGKYSRGVSAVASLGDAAINNTGSISVNGTLSYGVVSVATDGQARVTNSASGVIDVYSSLLAIGMVAISDYGAVIANNAGSITAHGDSYAQIATGIHSSSDHNNVTVTNRGAINAQTEYGAYGVLATIGGDDTLSVDNRGSIAATAATQGNAVGVDGTSEGGGNVVLTNRGTIAANASDGDAIGMSGTVVDGNLTLANTATGSITSATVDGDAIGLFGTLTNAGVTVNNAGTISVSSTNGGAYAIRLVPGTEGLAAGNATISNSGTLRGAVATGAGNDSFANQRGGVWEVTGKGTDFGAGNDTFANAKGATLTLNGASLAFGAGNNRFTNAGTLKVSGDNFIDMTDGSASASAAAMKPPKGAVSFTNTGIIDFLDGATDDSLTITGGFGGSGSVNLDVSLARGTNDLLFVNGATASGTKQVVNVALLDGLPKSGDVGKQLQLVHVSGGTTPSAFVAGNVLGVSPRDFLAMGMTLNSKPDANALAGGAGSSYLLSVNTFVKGLNAAGVLASSAALGVDNLMTSTTGSWRDRTYSLSASGKPAFATITPWVRGFSDEGGMSPDHLSANFGQMSNARVSQDNFGTELGLEYQALNGFRFGTLFAKSEGKQYLVDERGMDTIRGSTFGLYGTWVSPKGYYVDASWRTMQFEASIDSIGGRQRSDGTATTTNLEAGYTWTSANGLTIEPNVRYTSTSIDGLTIQGDDAVFESQDAKWQRASAGFSMWKTYSGGSGWRWTPYGELSLVRTFDGIANYSINDDYFGNVMTEGTSALVKFGIGAQKGRFSWNGGLNWMDGAAFDSALGGQMSLRYSW